MADLTPKALESEWRARRFRPAYMLFGEDAGSKSLALEALRSALKTDAFNTDDLSGDDDTRAAHIVSACATPPMFSDRRLVIVRGLKLGAAGRKLVADYLRAPLESTIMILISPERKPDPKDALAAAVRALGGVVIFGLLREDEAADRLQAEARRLGFELDGAAARLLFEEAGGEWGILRAELEKIKLFLGGRLKAGVEDVAASLGYRRETGPFDFPRALARRSAPDSIRLLRGLLRDGNDPFQIMAQITRTVNNQLKAKRMLKCGRSGEQILRDLRLHTHYDRDFLTTVGNVAEPRLYRSVRACLETERDLKSKSWLDRELELEWLVLRICGPAVSKNRPTTATPAN